MSTGASSDRPIDSDDLFPDEDTLQPAGKVVVTARLPPPGTALLRGAGLEVIGAEPGRTLTRTDLLDLVGDADAILCSLGDRVDDELLDAAPALRIVANFGVGYDNIDLAAVARHQVIATNTPDVLTDATADLAWALLLAAARRVGQGERLVRSGGWTGLVPDQPLGVPVSGTVLGVIGLGRIGAAVAARGRGFDMDVVYAGPRPSSHAHAVGARHVPIDELLATADFVVLAAPLNETTRHVLDAEALRTMKATSVLVNVGRGPLIDEAALVAALRTGRIFAAGLDVYEREPALAAGLAELDNVVLSPHVGSATTLARADMVGLVSENIIRVLSDRHPVTPIPRPEG